MLLDKLTITSYNYLMNLIQKVWRWISTHKKISIPAVIVLLLILFALRPKAPPQPATITVHKGTVTQLVSVSGTVTAKSSVNLTFPIGGTITWVGVKKGDTVTAGQTIATLDERTAEKNLQAALISYSLQRNTFDQNVANNNGISNPVNALNDSMKRILENNQYNLDQAVNSVELQDLAKQQAVLSTPIAGIVTRADAETPGVTALATVIYTITDPTSIVFDMDVDEADISKIATGQIAKIVLDPYPESTLSLPITSIDFVSHTTASGGNAYTVEAQLGANPNYRYRVGMNGNADIVTAERVGVLHIPLSALTDNTYVYVHHGKKFLKTKVALGLQSDTDAEVTAGLSEGEVVALDPNTVEKDKLVATK